MPDVVNLADAKRVLFLPGASGDGRFWSPLARLLPAHWKKVFFDWPGLGKIPASPDIRRMEDLVALVLTHVDREVDLVAQSMGGVVALRVALQRPEFVRRLVLAATSGGLDMRSFGAEDWRLGYVREFPAAAPWILQSGGPDVVSSWQFITAATLLLWSDSDRISPLAVGEEIARRLPNARLVVLKGGDHAFARDRADEFAEDVLKHLR